MDFSGKCMNYTFKNIFFSDYELLLLGSEAIRNKSFSSMFWPAYLEIH